MRWSCSLLQTSGFQYGNQRGIRRQSGRKDGKSGLETGDRRIRRRPQEGLERLKRGGVMKKREERPGGFRNDSGKAQEDS